MIVDHINPTPEQIPEPQELPETLADQLADEADTAPTEDDPIVVPPNDVFVASAIATQQSMRELAAAEEGLEHATAAVELAIAARKVAQERVDNAVVRARRNARQNEAVMRRLFPSESG